MRDPLEQLHRIQDALTKIAEYVKHGRRRFEKNEEIQISLTQGETIEQCIERAREAIEGYIESLILDNLPVPEETERPQMITISVAA